MPKKKMPPGVTRRSRPGHYEIRIRVKSRKTGQWINTKRRLRGVTLKEAEAERERLLVEAHDGVLGLDEAARMTLGAFADIWIERHKAKGGKRSTLDHQVETLIKYILPDFGDWFVDSIERKDVEDWLVRATRIIGVRTKKPLAPATINGWLRIFKALVNAYYDEYDLGPSPLARIKSLRQPPRAEDDPNSLPAYLLPKVLERFKEMYPQHYAVLFIGLTTGMRWGEVSALHWCDIDEQAGIIHIRRSQVRKHIGPPKTGKVLHLPLTPEMAEVLRWHRRRLVERQAPGLEKGIVFPSNQGDYSYSSRLTKPLDHVRLELGIPYRLTSKVMRRTFNNLLRQASVDRQVLRSLTGHSSEAMTGLYSTVEEEERKAAVSKVVELTRVRADNGE